MPSNSAAVSLTFYFKHRSETDWNPYLRMIQQLNCSCKIAKAAKFSL